MNKSPVNVHKNMLDGIKLMTNRILLKIKHDRQAEEERIRLEREREDEKRRIVEKELEELRVKVENERRQRKIIRDMSILFLNRDFFK